MEPLGEAGWGLSTELCVLGMNEAWELLRVSALREAMGVQPVIHNDGSGHRTQAGEKTATR